MAVVFQFIEDPQDGLGYVDTSKITIILKILPAVLLFLLIGIAQDCLFAWHFAKTAISVCAFCSADLGYCWHLPPELFCSATHCTRLLRDIRFTGMRRSTTRRSTPVSDVVVYYSYTDLQYLGRVVMSDGVIYPLSHDMKTGEVKEEKN